MHSYLQWAVDHEEPERKDYVRARKSLLEDQTTSRIRTMAKAIKDNQKLIRRAKAMCKTWYDHGHETKLNGEDFLERVWMPFEERLLEIGLTDEQVRQVKRYGFSRGKRLDLI